MDNVVEIPREKAPELLVGPFEEYRLMIDGRFVPGLSGFREGEKVWLTVDRRFSQPFDSEEAARNAAVLIAQASAIAHGYPHFGAETKDHPFAASAVAMDKL